jgi:predicted small secreted protein
MAKKKLATILVVLLLTGGTMLNACNTTEGVGEDIKSAGDAINEAAEDAQN